MATNTGQSLSYAGFWARVAAYFVDFSILIVLAVAINIGSTFAGENGVMIGNIVILLINLLYWPVMESSARQATFGKSIVGIHVTDLNGDRVSFIRAFLRNLAKIISAIPLGIGYLLAAFTGRKQALHDMITNTLVVSTGPLSLLKAFAAMVGALVIAVGGSGAYFYYEVLPKMQNETGGAIQEAMKSAMNPEPAKPPIPKGLPPAPAAVPKPPVAAPAAPVVSAPVTVPAAPQPVLAAPQPAITTAAAVEPVKPASKIQEPVPKNIKTPKRPEPAPVMDSEEVAPRARASLPEPESNRTLAPDMESKVIKPKYNDVMTAVLRGDGDAVKQLLDLGWWVDKPDSGGLTPLMAAVINRDTQMVQLLLDHGAVPSSQALKLARDKKDAATASLLEQRGAR